MHCHLPELDYSMTIGLVLGHVNTRAHMLVNQTATNAHSFSHTCYSIYEIVSGGWFAGRSTLDGYYLELIVASIEHPTKHKAPPSYWLCSSIDIRVTIMAVVHHKVNWVGGVFVWVVPRDSHCTSVDELEKHIHRRLDDHRL